MTNPSANLGRPQNGITASLTTSSTPHAFWLTLIVFVMSIAIGSLIPSFQSPDEDAHVKRAYLLAHGQIWLTTPPGESTGGLVDQGLLSYIEQFKHLPFHGEQKLSANDLYRAKQNEWSGTYAHTSTAGISYYFPLLYTPQALGIRLGESLNLSVHDSYQIAKLAALLTVCALLYWALTLNSFSALTLGLFVLPMSIFQMGSASLDGIAHAACFTVIALYLRITQAKDPSPKCLAYALCILIALLITSRMHLMPLLLLIFLAFKYTKQKTYLWGGIFATLFAVGWILSTVLLVVDLRVATNLKPVELIAYYAMHPPALFTVLFNTFTSATTLKSYATAFIGVLGWLDASLPKIQYGVLGSLLVLLTLSCFSWRPKTIKPINQLALVTCSLGSITIIFFSLLVQWTPHPATIILGVQGRYFFAPILLLTIAFSKPLSLDKSIRQLLSNILLIGLSALSLAFTSHLLLQRYYLFPERTEIAHTELLWSKPLNPGESIPLVLSTYQAKYPAKIQSLSLLYQSSKNGKAQLQLLTQSGQSHLALMGYLARQNPGYQTIPTSIEPYTSGIFTATEGAGLRIQGVKTSDGIWRACVIYELSDGSRRYTPGCP